MRETEALDKARKLMAKAEGTDNEQEADLFFNAAIELLAKYGLDQALLDAKADTQEKPGKRIFRFYGAHKADQRGLWTVVAKYNRCVAIQSSEKIGGRYEQVMVLVGFEADIDIVEMIYTSLKLQVDQRLARIRSYNAARTRSARTRYFAGFTLAIRDRLEAAQAQAKAEVAKQPGTDLVLRDRSLAVQHEFKNLFPNTRNLSRRVSMDSHYESGYSHGQRANLHDRPATGSTARGALTR